MLRWVLLALGAGAVLSPVGWFVTDHLESDDRFCIGCHLDAETPLHIDNFDDFGGTPPVSMAVAHAVAGNAAHEDGRFRCIDCHGGTGFIGKARVKALSARDAFWYLTGRFDEPDGMHFPLRDEDCTKCHDRFEETGAMVGGDPPFHALPVHNRELGVDCVTCHLSHERGGLERFHFLHPSAVRPQCYGCHPEFEEGQG